MIEPRTSNLNLRRPERARNEGSMGPLNPSNPLNAERSAVCEAILGEQAVFINCQTQQKASHDET